MTTVAQIEARLAEQKRWAEMFNRALEAFRVELERRGERLCALEIATISLRAQSGNYVASKGTDDEPKQAWLLEHAALHFTAAFQVHVAAGRS